jgi:pimeloyl-ACP methyl ester carboxylesterase
VRRAVPLVLVALLGIPALSLAGGTTPQQWAHALHHVRVNGADLAYLDVGQGDPIVLVHGTLCDYRAWLTDIPALSQQHRVIAYSRRYHFPNAATGEGRDYSLSLHVRDLAALMDSLGLGSVALVGHSYGATVATAFAARYPDRVRSLVVVEPSIPDLMTGTRRDSEYVTQRVLMTAQTVQALQNGFPELGIEHVTDWAFGDGSLNSLPRSVKFWMVQNATALRMQFLAAPDPVRFGAASLAKISCPVLYLEGGRSPWHAHTMADAFVTHIPATQRVTFKNDSHGIPWEDPKGFDRVVLEFLDRSRLASD